MHARLLPPLLGAARTAAQALPDRLFAATRPTTAPLITGTLADLARSKPALIAENALLRQQLIILRRSVVRPGCTSTDRTLLVLLASRLQTWRQSLLSVQPETLLRWHRELFRRFWCHRSRTAAPAHRPPLAPETRALIREMAAATRTWGAERSRGDLLTLTIRVATWTIQKDMRGVRPPRCSGQTWATFLRNHAHDIWTCDFLPVTDVLFRPLYAFFVIEVASRRVVHANVTRQPTDAWGAQQLREATPFGHHPTYLIRDNDRTYGPVFAHRADVTGIDEVCTADRAPQENAICERFLGSVRRECLDHLLILGEAQLRRIVGESVAYFTTARPHQGVQQRIPDPPEKVRHRTGPVRARPVLGGLHHIYSRAA